MFFVTGHYVGLLTILPYFSLKLRDTVTITWTLKISRKIINTFIGLSLVISDHHGSEIGGVEGRVSP